MIENQPNWPQEGQPQPTGVVVAAAPKLSHRITLQIGAGIVAGALILGGVAYGLVRANTHKTAKPTSTTQAATASKQPTGSSNKSTTSPKASSTNPTTPPQSTPGAKNTPLAGTPSGTGSTSTGTTQSGSTGTTGCAAGQIGTPPNCYPAPPAPVAGSKQWKLAWNEEFSGSDYDHSKLSPCFDWNYGGCTSSFNNGRETYDPGQVQVSNGTAKLIAAPLSPAVADNACENGSCTYKSGLLSTARPRADNGSSYLYTFTYGYVEARLKLPATQGFFTAFWMLPADPSYSYRSEIDILENLGYDNKTMFMTYHYNGRNQSYTPNTGVNNNGACPVTDLSGSFHTFGMDWQPTHIAWYIDGQKCGQFDGDSSTIENGPMQLILDLMVDNNWQRSWSEGLQDPSLVRQLEVDYLRVYQQQ